MVKLLFGILCVCGYMISTAKAGVILELHSLQLIERDEVKKEIDELVGHKEYALKQVDYHTKQAIRHTEQGEYFGVKAMEIHRAEDERREALFFIEFDIKELEKELPVIDTDNREDYIQYTQQKTIELPRMPDYHYKLASYAYDRCMERQPDSYWRNGIDYSCLSMVRTFTAENMGWNKDSVSPTNSNGTFDNGFCQLNSQYHWDFISSEEYKNPLKQLDYCVSVWRNAYDTSRMPWFAHYKVHERSMDVYAIE